MRSLLFSLLIPCLALTTGCQEKNEDAAVIGDPQKQVEVSTIAEDIEPTGGVLSRYDLEDEDPEVIDLPKRLDEISGLAVTEDGRVFGHNDERGVVNRISLESGEIESWFMVGAITLQEDLEGIAFENGYFWLVNSKGDLFRFREGKSESSVEFEMARTELSSKYDVEGLCYDPATNALLLACKEYPGEGLDRKDQKAVYSFSLDSMRMNPTPRFVLDVKKIEKELDLKKFMPSAIERDPETGNFILLSGNEPAIIELSPDGKVIGARALSKKIHPQPEGVTFAPDGSLLIGNEGGHLIRYSRR